MRFTQIKITNFGILADVSLSPTKENSGNVVFLNGSNGRGKTSFQSAVRWCFYGLSGVDTWLSKWAVAEAADGGQVEMQVELALDLDGDGTTAVVKRSQIFEKVSGSRTRKVGQEVLTVKTTLPGGLTDLLPNPEVWVKKYFPERFMNFFLFDGEMMKNFFDTRVKGAIEDAVREIAGVDFFEEVGKKLEVSKIAIDKAIAKKSGGQAEERRKALADARQLANLVEHELEKQNQQLTALEEEQSTAQKRWAGVESAAQDAERARTVSQAIDEKTALVKRVSQEFDELVLKTGSIALLGTAVPLMRKEIDIAHENGTLPPPFNAAALSNLLDRGTCICGNDLADHSDGSKEIQALIKNYDKSSVIGKKLDSAGRQLDIAKAQVQAEFQTIRSKNEQFIELSDDLDKLKVEQESLTDALGDNDDVALASLSKRIKELNREIPQLRVDIADKRKDLDDNLRPAERKAQDAFNEASANADEVLTLQQESTLTGELAQAAGAIHAVAIQLVRERLEASISEKFAVVKSGTFTTEVTADFEVLTFEEDGSRAELSEGEKMMKAYIFAFALREVVGLSFPLVVDTPFGRLDEYHRSEVAQMLANLVEADAGSSHRQALFLMHDGEYTPYTKKHFEHTKPFEAFLAWKVKEKRSELGVGIDPNWFKLTAWKDWKAGKIK